MDEFLIKFQDFNQNLLAQITLVVTSVGTPLVNFLFNIFKMIKTEATIESVHESVYYLSGVVTIYIVMKFFSLLRRGKLRFRLPRRVRKVKEVEEDREIAQDRKIIEEIIEKDLNQIYEMHDDEFSTYLGKIFATQGISSLFIDEDIEDNVDILLKNKDNTVAAVITRNYSGSMKVDPKDVQDAIKARDITSSDVGMVITSGEISSNARSHAEVHGISIIDRNDLITLIKNIMYK